MQCAECNSDNVQRLSVVYEAGTQKINTQSRTFGSGVGIGGGGAGLGFGSANTHTTGTSQSHLAQKAAPPKKRSFAPTAILAALGIIPYVMLSLPFTILLLLLAVAGIWAYMAYRYNTQQYPPLYQAWQKSWHCNKCGAIYTA